jgi:site-specific DNA recombinase
VPLVVGLYARTSTDDQRERSTIDAQLDYARRRAAAEGWDLRLFVDDGVSGTIALRDRPAGAELISAAAAREVDVVATYRVDRLGRSLRVILGAIDAIAVPYRSLTEPFDTGTPLGRALLGILAIFAELERDTFIARSAAGTERVARLDGRWLGGIVPYGYRKRVDGMLEIDERDADVVRRIFARCAGDGWSTSRIADELNALGIPTAYTRDGREALMGEILGTRAGRDGKRRKATSGLWRAGAVLRILHASIYRGRHSWGHRSGKERDLVERGMPQVVDEAVWHRAQARLRANDRWKPRGAKRFYLLRGLLSCSCGHALVGTTYRSAAGEQLVYRCYAHPKGERASTLRADKIEPLIWGDIAGFLAQPTRALEQRVRARVPHAQREGRVERQLQDLARELAEAQAIEGRLVDLFALGKLDARLVGKKIDETKAKIRELVRRQRELQTERGQAARMENEAETVARFLGLLAQRAAAATPEQRQAIARALVASCVVTRKGDREHVRVVYRFGGDGEVAATTRTDARSDRTWNEGFAEVVREHTVLVGRWAR